ncbi:MAG: lysylphosphatidylglycerol synthase domain-containing protein, partial [Vicinamibacterales bacterium]
MSSDELVPASAPVLGRRAGWRRRGASLVGLAVSGAMLAALYRSMDIRLIGETLLKADRVWLVISVGMILPITVLRAMRFFWVAPAGALPGVGEALRLTFVASALNVFVPAKAGDLIKSYFVAKRSKTSIGVAIAVVVYERLCDLFALISWCLLGWLTGRPQVPGLPSLFWSL